MLETTTLLTAGKEREEGRKRGGEAKRRGVSGGEGREVEGLGPQIFWPRPMID